MGSFKQGRFFPKYSKVNMENQCQKEGVDNEDIDMSPTAEETAENGISYINFGEEDQMEVYGYRFSRLRFAVCWISIISTLGTLRLIFHWYPRLYLYATHKRCSLQVAESVLLVENHQKRLTNYYVKTIKTLNLDTIRQTKGWTDDMMIELEKLGAMKLMFHCSKGIFKGMESMRVFDFKKHRYIWDSELLTFNRLRGLDYKMPLQLLHHREGVSPTEQILRRAVYGLNEITIPMRSISALLFLEVLNPFYVFQIFSLLLWFLDDYVFYAMTILTMSLASIIAAVYQTRKTQQNLRNSVESHSYVEVFHKNDRKKLATELLVPGDIIILPPQGCLVMCDAVLITGSCIVNESTLTGESVPVTKVPLPVDDLDIFYNEKNHARSTLFCGTKILQTRYYGNEPVLAVCIRTGFSTSKGGVVRAVLYPPPMDFKFEQDSYKFVSGLALIAAAGFLYTIYSKLMRGQEFGESLIDALDLVTIVVPPALPAATTVGCLHAQARLRSRASVFCISPKAINVAGAIDCVCFDKTGTLTEDGLDMWGVVPVNDTQFDQPIRDTSTLPLESNLLNGLATCHSLTTIDGKLTGDPLDLKMFESTKWIIEEPELSDEKKFDSIVPTVVKPPPEIGSDKEIGIIKQFPFSSNLQRMSVVTRGLTSSNFTLYCKGAPETILTLCLPESVPEKHSGVLQQYTQEGYRVIAIAYKELSVTCAKLHRMNREQLETNLHFLGLVILENLLKPESSKVLKILRDADIRTVMITGDNMQTALSVARDCGMVPPGQLVIEVHVHPPNIRYINATSVSSSGTVKPLSGSFEGKESSSVASLDTLESGLMTYSGGLQANGFLPLYDASLNKKVRSNESNNFSLALTGDTWSWIKSNAAHLVPSLVMKGVVFSRMSPEHKQQLIQDLQVMGYCVAMCGDGANDCGALRAAQAGISLSEAEASAASAFTARTSNVECVVAVIREGRAALVTSFGLFKYMAAYSLTQFVSVMLLYSCDSNLSDLQFLYIDLVLITSFAILLGHSPPFPGPLVKGSPQTSLVSMGPLLSLFGQLMIVSLIQVIAFALNPGFENYSVFTISSIQYILLAIVFNKGPPHRASLTKDYTLMIISFVVSLFTLYLMFNPAKVIAKYFELSLPSSVENQLVVLFLGLCNIVAAIIVEQLIVDYCIVKKFDSRMNKCTKWKKPYVSVELELIKNQCNRSSSKADEKIDPSMTTLAPSYSPCASKVIEKNCSALTNNVSNTQQNSLPSIQIKEKKLDSDPVPNNIHKSNCHNSLQPSHVVNMEKAQSVS